MAKIQPLFPNIKVVVELSGPSGNAFAILGQVEKALKNAGHRAAAAEYIKEATSSDYVNLLAVTAKYIKLILID
jgi:hypothetical protein